MVISAMVSRRQAMKAAAAGESSACGWRRGAAGLDRTYVSGIERGLRNPTLLVLLRLAQALEVSVTELPEEPRGRRGSQPQGKR